MIDINGLVKSSLSVPSKEFGKLHYEPNHSFIGNFLKLHRLSLNVRAVDVAKQMKVSKTLISLLESGEKPWSLQRIKAYSKAVDKLSERAEAKK